MNIPVVIEYKDKRSSSGKVEDGVIYLSISNRLNNKLKQEHINKLTDKLMSKIKWAQNYTFTESDHLVENDKELLTLAQKINNKYYNLPIKDAVFHKQTSTWGTCSLRTGRIYVSHRLIGAPRELLWYVIVHEICHLAVPGHNMKFWSLVHKACPDYKECRKSLQAYGMK